MSSSDGRAGDKARGNGGIVVDYQTIPRDSVTDGGVDKDGFKLMNRPWHASSTLR